MTARTEPLLQVRNLSKAFPLHTGFSFIPGRGRGPTVKAVSDVTFKVDRGQTLSLVGESGCGKSTVARLVTGLHRPDKGYVSIDGVNVTELSGRRQLRPFGRRLQMIFQDPFASLNPRWRVGDIIAEPIHAFSLADNRADVSRKVLDLLGQVGLSQADAGKYPHEFSGGQRQRISIARALASDPEFLVCDEPTSALDVSVQAQILNLLKELQEELGLGLLFISHNLAVVYHVSDLIGIMYLGRIVEFGRADDIFARPQHPYTRLLLDTIPDLEMRGRSRAPISGEVPNPISPPDGCVFHPRCPLARDVCRTEMPPMVATPSGVSAACHAVAKGWSDD